MGISITRLHWCGPIGAEALTIERFVLRGDGRVRHVESGRRKPPRRGSAPHEGAPRVAQRAGGHQQPGQQAHV
ncbi:hypothetical protein, partial [Rhodanobacter lindaniclasticus]